MTPGYENLELAAALFDRFAGRRSAYASFVGGRYYTARDGGEPPRELALTVDAITQHLTSDKPIGLYLMEPGESSVRFATIDVDDHDRKLTWEELVTTAVPLLAALALWGLRPLPCRSGSGHGIHLHMFWDQPQEAAHVRAVLKEIANSCGFSEGATGIAAGAVEIFPKQDRIAAGEFGSLIGLPFARSSVPLDDDLKPLPMTDALERLRSLPASAPVAAVYSEIGHSGREKEPPVAPGSPADIERICDGCAFIRHCRDDAEVLPEPEWLAMLSIVGRCQGGEELAHRWSEPYPRYTAHETGRKLEAALTRAGPWTCAAIRSKADGESYCSSCPHWGNIRSPISLGVSTLDDLAQHYAYVVGTKRFYDLDTLIPLDKEQFSDLHAHRHKRRKPATSLLQNPKLMKLDNLTYAPGAERIVEEEAERRLNLWRPGSLKPVPGDVRFFLEHMEYLFPDAMEREHLVNFLAFLVQRPGEKIMHAPLIIGLEGTGKSFLGQTMEMMLGAHNVAMVDTNELHSNYNGWIKDRQLVVVEEMMARGRLDLMNTMKPLITQPHVRINEKFVPQYKVPNRANFLLFSNHDDAILLSNDDRRYFVYKSPAKPLPKEYYGRLFETLEAEAGALLHHLLQRDLSGFEPKARAPMTVAKREVIQASRRPLEDYLWHAFEAAELPLNQDLAVARHVLDVLPNHLKGTVHAVARALHSLGGICLGQKRLEHGTKPQVWALRNHERWQQANEKEIAKHYEKPVRPGDRF